MSVSSGLLAALRDTVGAVHVRTDPDVIEANVVDWTGRFRGATGAGRSSHSAPSQRELPPPRRKLRAGR